MKGWTSLILPMRKTSVRRLQGLITRNCPSLSSFLPLVRVSHHAEKNKGDTWEWCRLSGTREMPQTWLTLSKWHETRGWCGQRCFRGTAVPTEILIPAPLLPPKFHGGNMRGLGRSREPSSWVVLLSVCFWGFCSVWEARRVRGVEWRWEAVAQQKEKQARRQEGGQEGAQGKGGQESMSGKEKASWKKTEIKVKWKNICGKIRQRKSKPQL